MVGLDAQRLALLEDKELEAWKRCERATDGPWFRVFTDDDYCMNAVYVGTEDRGIGHDNQIGMDGSRREEIVAATLIQHSTTPVNRFGGLWCKNANFIAHARTDIPELLNTIAELRGEIRDNEIRNTAERKGDAQ